MKITVQMPLDDAILKIVGDDWIRLHDVRAKVGEMVDLWKNGGHEKLTAAVRRMVKQRVLEERGYWDGGYSVRRSPRNGATA